MKPVVIVGTGLAGYNLAKEFRKHDATTRLLIFSADSAEFYSKPMLSNALAKGMTPDQLATASCEQMAAQLNATIYAHRTVAAIDVTDQSVTVGAETMGYLRLILAVGAEQMVLAADGDGAGEVLTVNSLTDYRRYRRALDAARRVAVIGPGLIGCEFANDLCSAGKEVVVIGPDAAPLGRLLPPLAGAAFKAALAAAGVEWRLATTVSSISRRGPGYLVGLDDGAEVAADMVLSAIGLRPNTALAQAAGLRVNRGIAVDRRLQTSAANVYALGDCAEVEGMVLPYVMPLMMGARALARTLAGMATEVHYPAMPVTVKTPAHPVVVSPPPAGIAGAWREEAVGDGVRAEFFAADGRRLLGFALTGAAVVEKQRLGAQIPPLIP